MDEQNLFLSDWERTVVDTRIHGTTRQQVIKVFNEVERSKLLPLPAGLFPVFEEAPRSVHRDGYVEVQRAYYSVPKEYVGRQVWVRWESRLIRVFNQRREQIALHALAEPGKFTTDPLHQHSPYRHVIHRNLDYLLDRARLIGKHTGTWAEAMVKQRGPIGTRVLHGLFALAGKHPVAALEAAAQKALHHGTCQQRMMERRTMAADFRGLKTLEDFDWSFNPAVHRNDIFDLATGNFIRQAKDVLFLGPQGVGKTHLAQAVGYEAIKMNFQVLYRSIFDLVRDFMKDEAFSQQDRTLRRYLNPEL